MPREHYELAEVSHEMTDHVTGESIACRVLFVFSAADQKVVNQQRKKKIVRIQKELATQPKPQRGCRQPIHRFAWTFDETRLNDAKAYDGYSAIVTTVLTREKSCDEIFSMFREQNLIEHANSQFTGTLAVRPLFLHSQYRVEALVFLFNDLINDTSR